MTQLYTFDQYRTDPGSPDGFAPVTDGDVGTTGVLLNKAYADDARDQEKVSRVFRAGGDLLDIVHEIVNHGSTEQRFTLLLRSDREPGFETCHRRDDVTGANYVSLEDMYEHADGIHNIRDVSIGASERMQLVMRLRVPKEASPGEIKTESWISGSDRMKSVRVQITDEADAVIVTNRSRLFGMCGDVPEAEASECVSDVSDLLEKLFAISDKDEGSVGEVQAVVYYADRDDESGKIRDWDNTDCVSLYGEDNCGYLDKINRNPGEYKTGAHRDKIQANRDKGKPNEVANILDGLITHF
jgi:hypothetical protein